MEGEGRYMKISVSVSGTGTVLEYARKEVIRFLEKYSHHQVGEFPDADREIALVCRNKEEKDSGALFRMESRQEGDKKCLSIISDTQSGVLAGVYEMLERMGLCFRMNGPVLNGLLDVAACDGLQEKKTSFCRHRGIRQHINFPMDISSYHIEEAQEYIRNLARMGLNSITFHSYTGQWHGYQTGNHTIYAGNYFYGQRYDVPAYEPVSRYIDNRKYYCIPEIEGQLSDEKARQAFSTAWLNRLMETCKEVGMQIVFSMELPDDEPEDNLVKIVRGVLKSYPLIDVIEWISPEGGGSGKAFPLEELEDKVRSCFGDAPFHEGKLPYIPDALPESLPGAMASLKRAVDLYARKDEILEGSGHKQIAIGLYVMSKETLKFLKNIMVSVLPGEVLLTFLPAHGSLAAAENIAFMEFTPEELQRTLLYSWIEFDGNMYLQQNSSKGIEKLLEETSEITSGASIYGICFNHWRTAENEITAGYMSKATAVFMTTREYYRMYAEKLGIGSVDTFVRAMVLLEDIDCYNRDKLFNIGFCYLGCWLNPAGLGWIRGWKKEDMHQSIRFYQEVCRKLEQCLEETGTQSGIAQLRLLLNRIQCSIFHIQCILELSAIGEIADDHQPERLTAEQKRLVEGQCFKALDYCKEYLDLHMEQLIDRGCQGTAVSYYATIPVYVDHIRQYFVYGEKECKHRPSAFDAPPPPDTAYLK